MGEVQYRRNRLHSVLSREAITDTAMEEAMRVNTFAERVRSPALRAMLNPTPVAQ